MYLQGQANRRSTAIRDGGFALAAMLVAIAILSVMLLVALPTWSHQARREKEIELIFRGEQYARAISRYQQKLAGSFPPSLDVLVEQKFLRQKYKDPITGEDFVPVYANSTGGRAMQQQGSRLSADFVTVQTTPGPDGAPRSSLRLEGRVSVESSPQQFAQGVRDRVDGLRVAGGGTGIIGVVSKSTAQSIRLYNGRDHYDQWIFTYMTASQQGGVGAPVGPQQVPGPGGRGQQAPGIQGPGGFQRPGPPTGSGPGRGNSPTH